MDSASGKRRHLQNTAAWSVPGVGGLECFRARTLTQQFDRHCHDAYVIGVIEAGTGGTLWRDTEHTIPANHIVVMNPGDVHTGYAADGNLSYRMFYVDVGVIQSILPARSRLPYFSELSINHPEWARRIVSAHRLLETSSDSLERHARYVEMLSDFIHLFGGTAAPMSPGRERRAVRMVKSYLHAHYRKQVTLEELAEVTHFDRAYLIRVFRRETGLPPHRYLIQIRVEQAKHLLAKGLPVAHVAQEVGFADQSHLTRHFKRLTGTTPRQYATGHFRSRN